MTRFDPTHSSLDYLTLKGSLVVLTGGSSGIGAATVTSLYAYGAKVVFGDLPSTSSAAQAVIAATNPESVHFVPTDVRSYTDNLALFRYALKQYGRVDHAIANAGVQERPGWFQPCYDLQAMEKEPDLIALDVNLKGVLYFAHIALAYLTDSSTGHNRRLRDRTLTLLSSIAGWKETPGLFTYQASKHGVLGLMRSLRSYVPAAFPGIRVNAVCPSMTETRMVDGIKAGWKGAGLPTNAPNDVARIIVALCAATPGTTPIWYDALEAEGVKARESAGGIDWDDTERQGVHGRALHVMGGECYDIEEGLSRTQDMWLGKDMSAVVEKGQKALGDGSDWV